MLCLGVWMLGHEVEPRAMCVMVEACVMFWCLGVGSRGETSRHVCGRWRLVLCLGVWMLGHEVEPRAMCVMGGSLCCVWVFWCWDTMLGHEVEPRAIYVSRVMEGVMCGCVG